MSWQINLTKYAEKQLRRLSAKEREHIERTIGEMEANPFHGDIVKLSGEENEWRRRVGSYRIMYNLLSDKRVIFIYDIKRRASNTY